MTEPTAVTSETAESVDAVVRVIDECVLSPIEGLRPAGEDIRGLKLWVDLRTARPKAKEIGSDQSWQLANPVKTDWTSYGDMVERALCSRTKDLELAMFLVEARARTAGFAGVRDGLWMVCGLIEGFADSGLFPSSEDGDQEITIAPLYWLNKTLPVVIHELDLTRSPEGQNFSLNYRIEAFAPRGGLITRAQWDQAVMAGSAPAYIELQGLIEQCQAELVRIKDAVVKRYGPELVSFSDVTELLEKCHTLVTGFLLKVQNTPDVVGGKPPSGLARGRDTHKLLGDPSIDGFGVSNSWEACEELARSGKVDQALRDMVALAAAEPNGRIRFHRKLLLADLCTQTNRRKLAASILQELNEIIEIHKLESWETSEIVGGVWARLVQCYRDGGAGTANEEREAEFYSKLSRLDPWQALVCGEPTRKD